MKDFKMGKKVIKGNVSRIVAGLGMSLPLLLAGPAAFAALDLGPAADFAVFQMGSTTSGGSWTSSDVTINGDVAFRDTGPGGSSGTIVNGNVEGTITASAFASRNWTVSGTYTQVADSTLQAIAQQARDFSATAVAEGASLPNIGTIGSTGSYTFTAANLAEPGTYIVNATSVSLSGGAIFTLDGSDLPAGSRVILNVANGFALTGGSQINLSGGLTPAQVLINYTGTSAAGASGGSAGTSIFGTFLGPNTTANFNAAATVIYGSLLVQNVNLSSHLTIEGIPFVPEPSTAMAGCLLLLPLVASTLRIVRKR